jgi:hypothetical protein
MHHAGWVKRQAARPHPHPRSLILPQLLQLTVKVRGPRGMLFHQDSNWTWRVIQERQDLLGRRGMS